MSELSALAVVVEAPQHLVLRSVKLTPPGPDDVVVDIQFSGISTGTERLLWNGSMPAFPGMAYPLVPGYESVGTIVSAGQTSGRDVGELVFVPGARCYAQVRGLFGGAASRVVLPGSRAIPIAARLQEQGVLLALAATAYHALRAPHGGLRIPELIVGHGVLGRLLARLVLALGHPAATVWESNPERAAADDYRVTHADEDPRTDYRVICDVSGADDLLDTLIARLAHGGEVVLAGFYAQALRFSFPPAFMREARFSVAAEWQPADLAAVQDLLLSDRLSLDGLITHRHSADQAEQAYFTAFNDPGCLKMILDWRAVHQAALRAP